MIYLKCICFVAIVIFVKDCDGRSNFRTYSKDDLIKLRDRVGAMFHHAYDGYLRYAYPYDELRPLSCDGVDTWGSYSLTLIDALDTLAIMGNYTEFRRVYKLIASERTDFDANINVSVFETNIRIVGGLLSAHLFARRAGVELEPGWPCNGPLLRLAEDAATRLLPAFDTPTGMPYGTVNLRHGVPSGETPITCTAGVGTFLVEFGSLSRLTGNMIFEKTALRAMNALWHQRSPIGLLGNHIDVLTGKWTATDAGIGAGVDSYYEYLVKGSILLQRPELMKMFRESREAIDQFLKHDDWHFWVTMKAGTVTMPVFQSLEAFWPGILSLVGDNISGLKTIHNYHQVWKQYGFLPEFYNVAQNTASAKREGYPLRPELVESAMYLYQATRDPFLINLGEDMLESIEFSARTVCGYATVKDVRDHTLEDRMESFFLAETTKYLYLLFDVDNFIHNRGNDATLIKTPRGQCVIDAGGYIFNTEAHPVDPAVLECCTGATEDAIMDHFKTVISGDVNAEFRGDTVASRLEAIDARRREEAAKRRAKEAELQKMLLEQQTREREALRKKKELEEIRRKRAEEAAAANPTDLMDETFDNESDTIFVPTATSADRESLIKLDLEVEFEERQKLAEENPVKDEASTPNLHKGSVTDQLVEEMVNPDQPVKPTERTDQQIQPDEEPRVTYDTKTINMDGIEIVYRVPQEPEEPPKHGQDQKVSGGDESKANGQQAAIENPYFSPATTPTTDTVEKPEPPLLIKKQSKDEATESSVPRIQPDETQSKLEPMDVFDALNNIIQQFVPSKPAKFDIDDYRERLFLDDQYPVNRTWLVDFTVMSCPARHFLERFSVQGEFFDSYE